MRGTKINPSVPLTIPFSYRQVEIGHLLARLVRAIGASSSGRVRVNFEIVGMLHNCCAEDWVTS